MTMPVDLVLVRHGQSEQNLAIDEALHGNRSMLTEQFRATPDSQFRLSNQGRIQADLTGKWMRTNGLGYFERRYVSDYVRAKETAAYLNLDGPNWYVDPSLREREWGSLDGMSWEECEERIRLDAQARMKDPFYWVPSNGESIAQLTVRLRILLDVLHRECSDMRVIVVCHGEVMLALRFMLERMSVDNWIDLEYSDDPSAKIHNCQILHYTRRDPQSGTLSSHLDWMQSLCPCQPGNNSVGWMPIRRETFSNEDLISQVDRVPRLFD